MDQRIPIILHPLLQEYLGRLKQEMPGQIVAFYLEGSIALGEFNPRLSDIDFIAVLNGKITTEEFLNILRIHKALEKQYPAWKMSGMYFQVQDIGCQGPTKQPFSAYRDGRLKWANRFDLGLVTWWILKNHGVTVFGMPPQFLNITVNMEDLIRLQRENLNTYWASWTTRPGRVLTLASDWGIQWTVLGVLREFYTIHEQQVTSKMRAGEYALSCLPGRWHPLIREAMAIRQPPKPSYYPSRIQRAFDAFHFVKSVIQDCNNFPAPDKTQTIYKG
jgi:hypothetical protein